MGRPFKIHSEFAPTGDQPQAIRALADGFRAGNKFQTLLGVTGSGKTFTMANVIQELQKPTLVLAHNKTLAAQLYSEFKEFFPENSVEYFVSYYDYYQPEAYVPSTDTYIAKDSAINDEIDRLRHSATAALSERSDVIIVASVSCIYGLGSPIDYKNMVISLRPGMIKDRDEVIRKLIDIQYDRNDMDLHRGTFRVRGDVIELITASTGDTAVRIEFFGDEVDRITEIDTLTGEIKARLEHIAIFPASHYVVSQEKMNAAIKAIEEELVLQVDYFKRNDKLIEAQRIAERTNFDVEMMRETGFCSGIENYSRHLAGLPAGATPHTLLDYFPKDFLLIIDESHMTLPQVRGMYFGDRSRKQTLVDYGFRLPSALDNRPLNFAEFESKLNQVLFTSATPADYEREHESLRTEQIIRDMRLNVFDVLVGINLLREGLDIPEVSLVAILDADKEGFLRSETSLIQTIGRAARNADGHVIMYADMITESMQKAITETERRRAIQSAYNEAHGITPQTIKKAVRDIIHITESVQTKKSHKLEKDLESMDDNELKAVIEELKKAMGRAAADLNFEEAAVLRDKMLEARKHLKR